MPTLSKLAMVALVAVAGVASGVEANNNNRETAQLQREHNRDRADLAKFGPEVTKAVMGAYESRRNAHNGKQPGRFFHTKTHLAVRGSFHGFAEGEGAGIFAKGNEYGAVVRFSSGEGKVQKDQVSDLKGIAIKINAKGFEGERLELPRGDDAGMEHDVDLIGATGEAHFFSRVGDEAELVLDSANKAIKHSHGENTFWESVATVGDLVASASLALKHNIDAAKKAGTVKNIFEVSAFHSQVPFEYKGKMIRYMYVPFVTYHDKKSHRFFPASPHLAEFIENQLYSVGSNTISTLNGEYGPIKSAGIKIVARHPGAEDDVHDAQKVWKHATDEHIGTIRFDVSSKDNFYKTVIPRNVAESLSFNPGRGFKVHRPLGAINELRVGLYQEASHVRVAGNYFCPFSGKDFVSSDSSVRYHDKQATSVLGQVWEDYQKSRLRKKDNAWQKKHLGHQRNRIY